MFTMAFQYVLSTSLSMIPVVLLLLALTPITNKRYTPRTRHLLWLLVVVRLIIPISLPQIARFIIPASNPIFIVDDNTTPVIRAFAQAETRYSQQAQPFAAANQSLTLMNILSIVWLIGVIVLLLYHVIIYQAMQHQLRRWRVIVRDLDVLAMFNNLKQELSINKKIRLYKCKQISSPMLIGFFSPCVILPADQVNYRYLRCALQHELQHYKRGDLWYKLILLIMSCIHWFNPIVYFMGKQAETAMELSCDQDVLRDTDRNIRRIYGLTILSFSGPEKVKRYPLATYFKNEKKQMNRRLIEIMKTTKRKRGLLILVITIAAIGGSGMLIFCSAKPVETLQADNTNAYHPSATEIISSNTDTQKETIEIDPEIESWLMSINNEFYDGCYYDGYGQVLIRCTDITAFQQSSDMKIALENGWNITLEEVPKRNQELENWLIHLDNELYSGFHIDNNNQVYVQTTDVAAFKQLPDIQMAIEKKDWEFTLEEVSYSFKELKQAADRLEAVSFDYNISEIIYYYPKNALRVEVQDTSEENKNRIQTLAGIDNIILFSS